MLRSSRAHLRQVGESYFEHMRFALMVGALAVGAGLACILHAIVPALCPTTCSRTVRLLQRLFDDRSQLPSVLAQSSPLLLFVTLMGASTLTGVVVAFCTFGSAVGLVVVPQAFALPIIFLWQNPELERAAIRAR